MLAPGEAFPNLASRFRFSSDVESGRAEEVALRHLGALANPPYAEGLPATNEKDLPEVQICYQPHRLPPSV